MIYNTNKPCSKHFSIVVPILLVLLFLAPSCKKASTPVDPPVVVPEKPKLTLAVDDTTCMEAWLKLTIEHDSLPALITVLQDGGRGRTVNLFQKDTVLYYDSLLPAKNYTYTAKLIKDSSVNHQLGIRTMDTTSHNYTWQVWELGDGPGDQLLDVAILDDNTIWAVGSVYFNDSTGHLESSKYNLLKWDGISWKKYRATYGTQQSLGDIYAIYAFGKNDIWLGNYLHWDGTSFFSVPLEIEFPTKMYGIWGKSWQDITVVGVNGLMAHYNGSGWTKLPTLTNYFLNDIFGSRNNDNIYAVGGESAYSKGTVIERKNGVWKEIIVGVGSNQVTPEELFNTKLYGSLSSVWIDQKGKVYIAGGFAYQYNRGNWNYLAKLPYQFQNNIPNRYGWSYIYTLRGQYSNDVMIGGELNTLQHFNGYSWRQVGPPFNSTNYNWRKVEMKGNTAVAVGYRGSKAVVMILKRN